MFVSVKQFATITGISCNYVRQLCKSADFPAINSVQKYYIDRDAAIQYLKDKAVYREFINVRQVKRGKRAV